MTQIIKLKVDKINPEPSVNDMKEFGLKYSKREWLILTDNRKFLYFFDKDLDVAQKIADIILNIKDKS